MQEGAEHGARLPLHAPRRGADRGHVLHRPREEHAAVPGPFVRGRVRELPARGAGGHDARLRAALLRHLRPLGHHPARRPPHEARAPEPAAHRVAAEQDVHLHPALVVRRADRDPLRHDFGEYHRRVLREARGPGHARRRDAHLPDRVAPCLRPHVHLGPAQAAAALPRERHPRRLPVHRRPGQDGRGLRRRGGRQGRPGRRRDGAPRRGGGLERRG
mmetsp:Transcript_25846/g.88365  ORF Transcript_25846/g.88365 Transcript_25846/m.88365 type:complete len:217 (-) Transcript_25846:24-674(-)